jgi:hypothetical protein
MQTETNGKATAAGTDFAEVLRAAQRAVREALWRHKVLGETIVVEQDGRIVHLTGDQIKVTRPEP